MPEVWLAAKVVAPVLPAEEAWIEGGNVLFRWGTETIDALSAPDRLLTGVQSMATGPDDALCTFFRRCGPFNFEASSARPGEVWRRSLKITSGPHAGEYLGNESVAAVRFFAERVNFLYKVGLALNLRGRLSTRATALRQLWPSEDERARLALRAHEIQWPIAPTWGRPPESDQKVMTVARDHAQGELNTYLSGADRPALSVELVFQPGPGGKVLLKPRTKCPTLSQAVSLALIWMLQRGVEAKLCKCGCGRWVQESTGVGRPREFFEDRCRWRFFGAARER